MTSTFTPDDITIREMPAISVAVMEHRGDPATIGATIQRFIAWRKANGLTPRNSPTFNVFHSDPETSAPDDYRIDLCVGTDRLFEQDAQAVVNGTIPAGRCAVLQVTGSSDNLAAAALYLYGDWLPHSGEEARDFPLYCQRLSLFPDVAEHEAVTELYLPLR